jgi:uncharacterized membrane protein
MSLRLFRSRPRLWISTALGLAVALLLPQDLARHALTRGLIGWNGGALAYLLLAGWMMARARPEQISRRAVLQDDGRFVILGLVVAAAVAVLLAIASQLVILKDLHGLPRSLHAGLVGLTVFTSWTFTQVMFALHYAHDYFLARAKHLPDVLNFPGTTDPGYGDFVYFAAVIGTSGQTADVSITGSPMRRVALVHCVLAYFFNTTVLALTINIAASLL